MNTLQLEQCLKLLNIQNSGVYALDTLPNFSTKYPECGIVNSDPSNLAGTHWFGFYREKRQVCEFFDSFARPAPLEIVKKLCSDEVTSYFANPVVVQHQNSITCGIHCLYYLNYRNKGGSLLSLLNNEYTS